MPRVPGTNRDPSFKLPPASGRGKGLSPEPVLDWEEAQRQLNERLATEEAQRAGLPVSTTGDEWERIAGKQVGPPRPPSFDPNYPSQMTQADVMAGSGRHMDEMSIGGQMDKAAKTKKPTATLRKTLTGASGAEFFDPTSNTVTLGPGFTQEQVLGAEAERRANRQLAETGYAGIPTLTELRRQMYGGSQFLDPREMAESVRFQRGIIGDVAKQHALDESTASEAEYRRGMVTAQQQQNAIAAAKQAQEMLQALAAKVQAKQKLTPEEEDMARRARATIEAAFAQPGQAPAAAPATASEKSGISPYVAGPAAAAGGYYLGKKGMDIGEKAFKGAVGILRKRKGP